MSIIACSVNGCEKPKRGPHGYCGAHWVAWKNHGDPTVNLKATGRKPCSIGECEAFAKAHGLCSKHVTRLKRTGDPLLVRPRAPKGSANTAWVGDALGYFGAHARVRSARGQAKLHACIDCNEQASQWSYSHADTNEKIGVIDRRTGSLAPYSLDPSYYEPRCVTCHKRFDATR